MDEEMPKPADSVLAFRTFTTRQEFVGRPHACRVGHRLAARIPLLHLEGRGRL